MDEALRVLQELDEEFYHRLPKFSRGKDSGFGFTPQDIHEVIIKKIESLAYDVKQGIRCPKHDMQPLYDRWCAECYVK